MLVHGELSALGTRYSDCAMEPRRCTYSALGTRFHLRNLLRTLVMRLTSTSVPSDVNVTGRNAARKGFYSCRNHGTGWNGTASGARLCCASAGTTPPLGRDSFVNVDRHRTQRCRAAVPDSLSKHECTAYAKLQHGHCSRLEILWLERGYQSAQLTVFSGACIITVLQYVYM